MVQIVNGVWEVRVSRQSQISLPAELCSRWDVSDGGSIGIVDLGDAALVLADGLSGVRSELRRVLKTAYDDAVASLNDPDLADQ